MRQACQLFCKQLLIWVVCRLCFSWWKRLGNLCMMSCWAKIISFLLCNRWVKFHQGPRFFVRSISMNTRIRVAVSVLSWRPSKRCRKLVVFLVYIFEFTFLLFFDWCFFFYSSFKRRLLLRKLRFKKLSRLQPRKLKMMMFVIMMFNRLLCLVFRF